jgi:hypothetical protein
MSLAQLSFALLAIAFSIICAGCATREINTIHTSLESYPETQTGNYYRVATEDDIPVTVGGEFVEKPFPGHILVHPRDFETILDNISDD